MIDDLFEMTYKDLMREIIPGLPAGAYSPKLPHKDWQALIRSVHYDGFKKDTFRFLVPSRLNAWQVYVQFDQFNQLVNDHDLTAPEAARLMLWTGDVRVHCNCPSFLFHGYKYILTQLDASIYPEGRFPKIKNPDLKGVACKHARRTLQVLPFQLGPIASAVKTVRATSSESHPKPRIDVQK